MDRSEAFYRVLRRDYSHPEDVAILQDLIADYPYFQLARIVLAAQSMEQSDTKSKKLRVDALAHSPDPWALMQAIHGDQLTLPSTEIEIKRDNESIESPSGESHNEEDQALASPVEEDSQRDELTKEALTTSSAEPELESEPVKIEELSSSPEELAADEKELRFTNESAVEDAPIEAKPGESIADRIAAAYKKEQEEASIESAQSIPDSSEAQRESPHEEEPAIAEKELNQEVISTHSAGSARETASIESPKHQESTLSESSAGDLSDPASDDFIITDDSLTAFSNEARKAEESKREDLPSLTPEDEAHPSQEEEQEIKRESPLSRSLKTAVPLPSPSVFTLSGTIPLDANEGLDEYVRTVLNPMVPRPNPRQNVSDQMALIESFAAKLPELQAKARNMRSDQAPLAHVLRMAEDSATPDDSIASERMAKLLEQQGYIEQAIRMLGRLQEQKPKKSAYFAREIERLRQISNKT